VSTGGQFKDGVWLLAPQAFDVTLGRRAEQSTVFTAELAWALIADLTVGMWCIEAPVQHQMPRFMKAHPFATAVISRCLNGPNGVSVRTPALGSKARLPVLVNVHGGSNAAGGAGSLAEDAIHREGIVLVKVQYRLGAFGFLGLDALRAEDPHKSSANYGLLDQIAALKWVKSNIAVFGGTPANVTVSGNSAGATDVLFLTYSPLAKGLFQRAILQSPAPGAPRTAAQSEAMGNVLLDRLKLPHVALGLAALRTLPAETINAAAQNLPTSPGVDMSFTWELQNVDGYVLPDSYAGAYANGAGRGIAVIIGANTQELGADRKPEAADPLVGGGGVWRTCAGGACTVWISGRKGAGRRSGAGQHSDAGDDGYVVPLSWPLACPAHAESQSTCLAV